MNESSIRIRPCDDTREAQMSRAEMSLAQWPVVIISFSVFIWIARLAGPDKSVWVD
jgi:uncharacterized membrane protein